MRFVKFLLCLLLLMLLSGCAPAFQPVRNFVHILHYSVDGIPKQLPTPLVCNATSSVLSSSDGKFHAKWDSSLSETKVAIAFSDEDAIMFTARAICDHDQFELPLKASLIENYRDPKRLFILNKTSTIQTRTHKYQFLGMVSRLGKQDVSTADTADRLTDVTLQRIQSQVYVGLDLIYWSKDIWDMDTEAVAYFAKLTKPQVAPMSVRRVLAHEFPFSFRRYQKTSPYTGHGQLNNEVFEIDPRLTSQEGVAVGFRTRKKSANEIIIDDGPVPTRYKDLLFQVDQYAELYDPELATLISIRKYTLKADFY